MSVSLLIREICPPSTTFLPYCCTLALLSTKVADEPDRRIHYRCTVRRIEQLLAELHEPFDGPEDVMC